MLRTIDAVMTLPSSRPRGQKILSALIAPAVLAGAFFCAVSLSPNVAARDLNQDEALQLRKSGKLMSLDSLLQTVRQRYPDARLLEAELENEDGKLIYELEVLTDKGNVRELELDAGTGALLKDEEED
jgi:hypothetical protein